MNADGLFRGPDRLPISDLSREQFIKELEMVFCGHNERAHPCGSDRHSPSLT